MCCESLKTYKSIQTVLQSGRQPFLCAWRRRVFRIVRNYGRWKNNNVQVSMSRGNPWRRYFVHGRSWCALSFWFLKCKINDWVLSIVRCDLRSADCERAFGVLCNCKRSQVGLQIRDCVKTDQWFGLAAVLRRLGRQAEWWKQAETYLCNGSNRQPSYHFAWRAINRCRPSS